MQASCILYLIVWLLGPLVETLRYFLARKKFLIVYFLSGIIGSLGSFLFSYRVGVGASGAIFGLLGANLYLLTLNPKLYKRIYGTDVLSLIGINLVIGFIVPNIDNAAHLAGLVGGYLAAWSVGLKNQSPFKAKHMIAQAVVVVLIAFSLVWVCRILKAVGSMISTRQTK